MSGTAVDALFSRLFDYAGVFPPAQLDLEHAIATYARCRGSDDGWMVGSFVVGADQVAQLDPERAARMPLSVVIPASVAALDQVRRAGERFEVVALEFRPAPTHMIQTLAEMTPPRVEAFFEVPGDAELERRLDAIASAGACAKIRTGGITADAFPAPDSVVRFFEECHHRGVNAKATAGLHHALTGRYSLTYEAGSSCTRMYGYLNVCTAAALLYSGGARADALEALSDSSPSSFDVGGERMRWRGHSFSAEALTGTRRTLFRSFGTCSLHEPIDEWKGLRRIDAAD
jgi:hypothetical protein